MSFSALPLRECDAPCSTLKLLPTWSHRGLCSVPLRLTAIDVNNAYVALGSSGGTLFVHYRARREMHRFELRSEPITAVKLLCCLDDLVAVGTSYGAVVLLQLHSPASEHQSQLQRFEVSGQHCGSVSALTWATNGMKLFSGDEQGRVVCTLVDWDQGVCNSSLLHEEPSAVIQLDYAQRTLLIAAAQRAVLCRPGQQDPPLQVGTKQRKSSGQFGACFNPGWCTPANQMLFATRPGLRMWLSDMHGAVKATYMFRSVLETDPKTIPLLTWSPMISSSPITERQLGLLCPFTRGLFLSWNEHALYVLDLQKQAVVGSVEGLPAIVTVACSEDEIFVLHGNREIICIAFAPEGQVTDLAPPEDSTRWECEKRNDGEDEETSLTAKNDVADVLSNDESADKKMEEVLIEREEQNVLSVFPGTVGKTTSMIPDECVNSGNGTDIVVQVKNNSESQVEDGTFSEKVVEIVDVTNTENESNNGEGKMSMPAYSQLHIVGSEKTTSPTLGLEVTGSKDSSSCVSRIGSKVGTMLVEEEDDDYADDELLARPIPILRKKKRVGGSSVAKASMITSSSTWESGDPTFFVTPDSSVDPAVSSVKPDKTQVVPGSCDWQAGSVTDDGIAMVEKGMEEWKQSSDEQVYLEKCLVRKMVSGLKDRTDGSENNAGGLVNVKDNVNVKCESSRKEVDREGVQFEEQGNPEKIWCDWPAVEMPEVEKTKHEGSTIEESGDTNIELMMVSGVDGIIEGDEVEQREVEAPKTLWQVCEPCTETLQQFPVPIPLIPADISQEIPNIVDCSDWHEETDEFEVGKDSKPESLPCFDMDRHTSGTKPEMALSTEDVSDAFNDPQVPHSLSFEEHHAECYSIVPGDGTTLQPLFEENLEKYSVAENVLHAVSVDKVACEIDVTPAMDMLPEIAAVPELAVDSLAEKMNEQARIYQEEESSDDDLDIYAVGIQESSSDTSFTETTTAVDWERKAADKVGPMMERSSSELLPSDDEGVQTSVTPAAESWVVYASPSQTVACLAASDRHLWCVDRRGGLFYCPISSPDPTGLRWNKYEEGVTQVAVSPSGALLWRVDAESGRVLACSKGSGWSRCHWFEASLSPTAHIALSEGSGWIVGTDGQVWLQPGLSGERPCSHGVQVAGCPLLAQIAVRGSVVWALTFDPTLPLLYREGVSSLCPQGERWLPDSISLQEGVQPVSLALGDVNLLWMVDTNGQVWFRRGVTPDHPAGEDDHWWQLYISESLLKQSTLQSSFVHSMSSPCHSERTRGVSKVLSHSHPPGHSLPILTASSCGLWLAGGHNRILSARGLLTGMYWSPVVPRGTTASSTWVNVLVSPLPEEDADIRLVSVACGTEAVWACDATGIVYFRMGTQPLNPSNMLPAWVSLEPPSQGAPLCKLASSVDDRHVWALDAHGGVFVRNGISDMYPIGTDWEFLPELRGIDLAVSSTTTWLLLPGGGIARRVGIRATNHAGDYWRRMPGCLSAITVNETDEVWGVSPNGSLLRRFTCTIRFPKDREEQSSPWPSARLEGLHCQDILGDDWEVL
uniref:tectonin beta-propeller repeat-containing protein 2 isoform X2 n=1 Tax=Myxine glutinosa TaxID=7769 RepID=UPI0035900CBA